MSQSEIVTSIVNCMWDTACLYDKKFTSCTTLQHAFEIIFSDTMTCIKGELGFIKFLPEEYIEAWDDAQQQFINEFNEKFENYESFMKETYDITI